MFTHKVAMFSDASEMCPMCGPVLLNIDAEERDVVQCRFNDPVPLH